MNLWRISELVTDLTPSEPNTPKESLTVYNTDNNVGNINVIINT